MQKIEITARVFKVEDRENSKVVTVIHNGQEKKNNEYVDVKTFYSCIFKKENRAVFNPGDLFLFRGNFSVDTYKRNSGEYTSGIKIFVTEYECMWRSKRESIADTSNIPSQHNESDFNTSEE